MFILLYFQSFHIIVWSLWSIEKIIKIVSLIFLLFLFITKTLDLFSLLLSSLYILCSPLYPKILLKVRSFKGLDRLSLIYNFSYFISSLLITYSIFSIIAIMQDLKIHSFLFLYFPLLNTYIHNMAIVCYWKRLLIFPAICKNYNRIGANFYIRLPVISTFYRGMKRHLCHHNGSYK